MMNKTTADKKTKKHIGGFPPADAVQDGIALRLKELYADLENEGIPESLLNLLEKLDEAERAQSASTQAED